MKETSDLLLGVKAIADHLAMSERQALHLHYCRRIPTFKMGRAVCATRSGLQRHFAALSGEGGTNG